MSANILDFVCVSPRQLVFTHHLTVKIRTRLKYKKIQYISEYIEESEDASIKLIYIANTVGVPMRTL